jgi:hypothetical protein
MLRALETFEAVDYRFEVDGDVIEQGEAILVKLMVDSKSASMVVNGCLFLNTSSFRYLDFETEDGTAVARLYGDGTMLEVRADPSREVAPGVPRGQLRMLEDTVFDLESFVVVEEEDDEE